MKKSIWDYIELIWFEFSTIVIMSSYQIKWFAIFTMCLIIFYFWLKQMLVKDLLEDAEEIKELRAKKCLFWINRYREVSLKYENTKRELLSRTEELSKCKEKLMEKEGK